MTYDAKVPTQLKKQQQWFGSIIGRPIDEENRMASISPSGKPMEIEAAKYISPSPTLKPAQRIQIYNQQYWWRLLKSLQESFPLVTRLLGYYHFNRLIAKPYLIKYPPRHWSLNNLGDRLPRWIKEAYRADNKKLVYEAASLDWAFSCSFFAQQMKPLEANQLATEKEQEALLSQVLYLQPHVYFFEFMGDLFSFRQELLKQDPDYWLKQARPSLKCDKNYFFVLYRHIYGDILWKEISSEEYRFLTLFKKGISIEKACDWLEKQNEPFCEKVMKHLQQWFQEWTMNGWLSQEKPSLSA